MLSPGLGGVDCQLLPVSYPWVGQALSLSRVPTRPNSKSGRGLWLDLRSGDREPPWLRSWAAEGLQLGWGMGCDFQDNILPFPHSTPSPDSVFNQFN